MTLYSWIRPWACPIQSLTFSFVQSRINEISRFSLLKLACKSSLNDGSSEITCSIKSDFNSDKNEFIVCSDCFSNHINGSRWILYSKKKELKTCQKLETPYLYNLILTFDILNYEFCSMKYSNFVKQSKVFCLFVCIQ